VVLEGDLVVLAAGDPSWSSRFFAEDPRLPLKQLASQLMAGGVRRVEGDLVVEVGRFPGRPFPPSRAVSEVAYGWAAPTSALAVDENMLRVEMGPGKRVGEPGTLRLLTGHAEGNALRLENHIRTVEGERHGKGTVDFQPVWESGTLVARGEYPISESSYTVKLATPRPDLAAGLALRTVLENHGVEIIGEVRVLPRGGSVAGRRELARFAGSTLAELLPTILEDSSNWHAEMLLRVLAAELHGEGRDTTGIDVESLFLREVVGLPADSFELDDASGISPYNLLSPETVVALLRWVWHQPWRELFLDALASPGEGTLKVWGRLPPLAAKSGTVRHSLALAGYLNLRPAAEPVIFAIFLNHRGEERHALRAEIVRLLRLFGR
jgi:D-alanyl-D-alanine carboxypeptidase/D-alanyl-D-alanine-endopeptidase (penicillin-binding protein 4)